ncbi:hypothetical protein GYH73_021205 [Bacillus megaterium]|nr:hypothetical protein [Priestia megaterium]
MKFFKDKIFNSDFAIWFSLAAALGYALYYVQSLYFNAYYKIPTPYIELKIQNLAQGIFYIGMMGCIFLFIYYISEIIIQTVPFLNKTEKRLELSQRLLLPCFFIVIGMISKYDFNYPLKNLLSEFPMFPTFLIAFIVTNTRKTIFTAPIIVLIIYLSIQWAGETGMNNAMNKETYLILEEKHQTYAVLNNYDNQFIIAPVDLKRKIITPEFQFIEMKSDKDNKVELKRINTGKLKVKEYAN